MPSQVQWAKLSEYLLQVGAFDEAMPFCVNALERLGKVVSFDQGRVYILDGRVRVYDEYLLGVSKKTTKAYHEYYTSVDDSRYSVSRLVRSEEERPQPDVGDMLEPGMAVRRQAITVIDWEREPHDTRFYREYVAPLGLTYSTGFRLSDDCGNTRAVFCIDRTRSVTYSGEERALLSLVASHLDNMFRKLYAEPPVVLGDTISLMASGIDLTERERQLCTMLMHGKTPKQIAEELGISRRTVYKHVSNIHAKLGVSNQAELIARLTASAARGRNNVRPTQ